MNTPLQLFALLLTAFLSTTAAQAQWEALHSTDGSTLTARHEAAGVVIGDDIYLIGGRGNRPVERFSSSRGQWENLGLAPLELHHMQPVAVGPRIFILGAFTCCYPREKLVAEIHVFDTRTQTWDVVGSMPDDRMRGSAAAVVYRNKIYLLGGNTRGHDGGAVPWFDEFDPATGQWRILPDAPHARDHFSAVMIGSQLIAAAGRQTALPSPQANPVRATDIYDFDTGRWLNGAAIPTVRGGAVAVSHGSELIVAGGEINTSSAALKTVEAFDVQSGTWRSLASMMSGRHGSGGGVIGRRLYMLSGASTIGGSTETRNAESLLLDAIDEGVQGPDASVDTGTAGDQAIPADESAADDDSLTPGDSAPSTESDESDGAADSDAQAGAELDPPVESGSQSTLDGSDIPTSDSDGHEHGTTRRSGAIDSGLMCMICAVLLARRRLLARTAAD